MKPILQLLVLIGFAVLISLTLLYLYFVAGGLAFVILMFTTPEPIPACFAFA